MKRFLSLTLALTLLVSAACATSVSTTTDYTMAGKLLKQLQAGSGFTGTIAVEIAAKEAGALSTSKPVVLGVDYIYVRPDGSEGDEHRADVTLMDGETALSAAHLQVKNRSLSIQADVVSPDWYAFGEMGAEAVAGSAIAQAQQDVLNQTGIPTLAAFALQMYAELSDGTDFSESLENHTTRIDLWIEGYRQNTVLGKLEDGTTTMEVQYTVSPTAIKAEAKQLVFDLLNDRTLLPLLQQKLGDEMATLYLNPNLQSWYFSAIDALPLAGDMTIARTVSLKGDTVALHITMPLYDEQGGAVTLRYDRTQGEGDLPDDNAISLTGSLREVELAYQEYSSMTGVRVMQGTLRSTPAGVSSFSVSDRQEAAGDALNVAFTLRREENESRDDEGNLIYAYNASLNLTPGEGETAVPATEIALTSRFISKELKTAATQMEATLVLGGDGWNQTITLNAEGRTRAKWEPEALTDEFVNVNQMTQDDVEGLLTGAALRLALLLTDHLAVPGAPAEVSPEGSLEAEATPEVFATLPPTEAPTQAPTEASTQTPTQAPTQTPSPSPGASPAATRTDEPNG